ncbi:MAG: PspA/IM30 family protein [Puniceicoccaceae bacterium 5H]|nr:MAG: PspA/IM30 family protein [Puniceicoccaceae bacterium 5H]
MNLWKRFNLTFRTEVTRLLDEVENHEAVADALLAKARQQLARAEMRLDRLQREREDLDQQQAEARNKAEQWQQRALQHADKDEALALQCLQRKKAAETWERQCTQEAAELEALIHEVEQELAESRRLIAELNRRKQGLAARELTARAQSDTRAAAGDEELTGLLDRWEEKVRARELQRPVTGGKQRDALEHRFAREEEQAELAAELAALRAHPQTEA